jgi:YD repeat-containing protein
MAPLATTQVCEIGPKVESVGNGSAGTNGMPVLLAEGVPIVDVADVRFEVNHGVQRADGYLAVGTSEDPMFVPSLGVTFFPGGDIRYVPFTLNDRGAAFVSPPGMSPPGSDLCGVDLVLQALLEDRRSPTGYTLTNAVRIRFGSAGTTPLVDPPESPTIELEAALSGLGIAAGSTILIEGGAIPVNTAVGPDLAFATTVPLSPGQVNSIFVRELFAAGGESAPVQVSVIQDDEPPTVFIDFPLDGQVLGTPSTNVSGRVSDMLSGFTGLTVHVNGLAATVNIGIGTNGTFDIQGVPLGPPGEPVTIEAVAVDGVGNVESASIDAAYEPLIGAQLAAGDGNNQVGPIEALLADPLEVVVTDAVGDPFPNKLVAFTVTESNGSLSATPGEDGGITEYVFTDEVGAAQVYWTLGSDAGMGNNRVSVSSAGIDGTAFFCASATAAPASQINVASGNNQLAPAGSPLAQSIRVWVNDGCNPVAGASVRFRVTEGGGALSGGGAINATEVILPTDACGHAELAWTLGDVEGNQFVQAELLDVAEALATFVARTLSAAVDSSLDGVCVDHASSPVVGAVCSLVFDSGEVLEAVTDEQGLFSFDALPATGPAHLLVDGSAAASPAGVTYPSLAFPLFIHPHVEHSLPRSVVLPLLITVNNVEYNGVDPVELTVAGIPGFKMIVAENTTVTLQDGTKVGPQDPGVVTLSLNQVPTNDVPMPMPDGAAPSLAWTVQPAEASFDPPLAIVYPNTEGLPPLTATYFLSFNHATNDFEIVATGHIVEDGSCSVSDPGSGISKSGWGCQCPPYEPVGECETCEERRELLKSLTDISRTDDGRLTSLRHADGRSATYDYDESGRLIAERVVRRDGHVVSTSYGYDDQGRLTSMVSPAGRRTAYTYDSNGVRYITGW